MKTDPTVAVLSRRLLECKAWQASQYEFEDVIADVANVHLMTPTARSARPAVKLLHRSLNRARTAVGEPVSELVRGPEQAVDVDLFFAVFASPYEIGALPSVRHQLSRSAKKVAFIVEFYKPGIPKVAAYLRQLKGFDHIFVFSRAALPGIQDLTDVPTSYLPTGVDALQFVPRLPTVARTIDVTSYGRRIEASHRTLVSAMADDRLHYHFDTIRSPFQVTSHLEHRSALAAALQRSRYSVIFKINDQPHRLAPTGGEETLTSRYFEATAAGAVVLGSRPDTPDFDKAFPWPDAVIPIRNDGSDVLEVMASLDADDDRLRAARRGGMLAALRRHDWVYRWQHILETVGLDGGPQLDARLARLQSRAANHDPLHSPSPAATTATADSAT